MWTPVSSTFSCSFSQSLALALLAVAVVAEAEELFIRRIHVQLPTNTSTKRAEPSSMFIMAPARFSSISSFSSSRQILCFRSSAAFRLARRSCLFSSTGSRTSSSTLFFSASSTSDCVAFAREAEAGGGTSSTLRITCMIT
jgi:hypothetical protein